VTRAGRAGGTKPASSKPEAQAQAVAPTGDPLVAPEEIVAEQAAAAAAAHTDGGPGAEPEPPEPLLLHSLMQLREVWLPLLEAADARSVVEIGSESGVTTSLLADSIRRRGGGTLVVVDPDPGVRPEPGAGLAVEIVADYSPRALDGLASADAYLVDGDHNYATVSAELAAIAQATARDARPAFPLVVLHDVGWPAGRRDQYYAPERIADAQRRSYTWEEGVVVGVAGVVEGGFRGAGEFAWATSEGGPRNGVRTAVEDFLVDRPDLSLHVVPAIFGLGVIVDRRAPWASRVRGLLGPWEDNGVLARLERNRLDLYLHVLDLQDEVAAVTRRRQRDWSSVDAERSALAERELSMLDRIGELERVLGEERRTMEALRSDLTARADQHPGLGQFRRRR
jgi:hypothetical protein